MWVTGSFFFLISTPSGLLEPTSCSATRCTAISAISTSGSAITWKAKKRLSVASEIT
jgi:hypothetical protein